MNELQELLGALGGDHGRLLQICTVIAGSRVFFKLAAEKIQRGLTDFLLWVHDSESVDDDKFVVRLLNNPFYWLLCFAVDALFSIKLPRLANFNALFLKPESIRLVASGAATLQPLTPAQPAGATQPQPPTGE